MTGIITVSDELILTQDFGDSLQFTLSCISTGGPATTVTWTRDNVTITEGTETVLDDPVAAYYTHTLTVTPPLGLEYRCTVTNNKPSIESATYILKGIVYFWLVLDLGLSCYSSRSANHTHQ